MLDGGLRGKARFTHPTENLQNAWLPLAPRALAGGVGGGGVRAKTARKALWVVDLAQSYRLLEERNAKTQRRKGSGSREEIKNSVAFICKRVTAPFYDKTATDVNSVSWRRFA